MNSTSGNFIQEEYDSLHESTNDTSCYSFRPLLLFRLHNLNKIKLHNNILDKNYFMVKSNICLLSTSLILFYYLTFSGFRCNQKSPTWVGLHLSLVYPLSVSTAVHVIAVLLRAFTSIVLPLGSLFVSTYPDAIDLSWMKAARMRFVVA